MSSPWVAGGGWDNRRRWFENEDQYVRRQREEAASVAASADARLRRSLDQVTQEKDALARQLAKLTAAFDAFVELTEARAELARFPAAEAVRGQVRELLGGLVRHEDVDASRVDDVSGYWLSGAASGLAALVRGDEVAAASAIAAASGCDERRTAVFLALGLAVVGAGEKAEPWVAPALGTAQADDDVSVGTRQVWRLATDGVFGPAGTQALVSWLYETGCTAIQLRTWLDTRAGRPARPFGATAKGHESAQRAVDTLAELSQIYLSELPTGGAVSQQDEIPAAVVLDGLIAEGGPEERELIRRVAELAADVQAYRSADETPPLARAWDASIGKLDSLLNADLSSAAAQRRAAARIAFARSAADLADILVDEVSTAPSAGYRIDLEQQRLVIDPNLPLDPQLAKVDAEIDRRFAAVVGVRKQYNIEQAQRAVERKAEVRQRIRAGIAVFAEEDAALPALHQAAERTRADLLARLGQLAENILPPQ